MKISKGLEKKKEKKRENVFEKNFKKIRENKNKRNILLRASIWGYKHAANIYYIKYSTDVSISIEKCVL